MIDKYRKKFCIMYRKMLNSGVPRKLAMLEVRNAVRAAGYGKPAIDTIYRWMKKFGISTR